MSALADVDPTQPASFDPAARNGIFSGNMPWGACAAGVLASKGELLQRFHRAHSMLARLAEEEPMLRVEAERSIIYFESCVAAIADAISECEAPPEASAAVSANEARAMMERMGRAHMLRKHLSTYKDLVTRARKLWSPWAPRVHPPTVGTHASADAAGAHMGDDGAGEDMDPS